MIREPLHWFLKSCQFQLAFDSYITFATKSYILSLKMSDTMQKYVENSAIRITSADTYRYNFGINEFI